MKKSILLLPLLFTAAVSYAQPGSNDSVSLSRYSSLLSTQGLTLSESYTCSKELFYVLPEGEDISLADGMDIDYLQPRTLRQREITALDPFGKEVVITEILNPEEYFEEHHMGYATTVFKDGVVRFYTQAGDLLYAYETGGTDEEVPDTTGTTSGQGFEEISAGIFRYESDSVGVYFDTHTGIEKLAIFNRSGEWERKAVTFYDVADTVRGVPLYAMHLHRDQLPGGGCVFRAETLLYTDYERHQEPPVIPKMEQVQEDDVWQVKIWPNPARDVLAVLIAEGEKVTAGSLELYSSEGNMVRTQKAQSGQYYEVNVSDLPAGLYILRLMLGERSLFRKIIIQ